MATPRYRLTLASLALGAPAALAANLLPGFQESVAFDGLTAPTAVRFAPDGQVFIAEKSGLIKIYDDLSDPSATVFADLRTNVMDYWDRGLLGLAIHPQFPAQPYVYVLYSLDAPIGGTPPVFNDACADPTGNGCVIGARLSRLTASGNVSVGEQVLIEGWCQQFPSHSIGDLHFGIDGALYLSAGDGASFTFADRGQASNPCGDPPNEGGALRSQDIRTGGDATGLNGAILRVDPETGAALPDNPLFGGATADDDRIVACGLRNPFRFNLRHGTSEIWIGDVGWDTWEEIDRVIDPTDGTVRNFGWPCYEGVARQSGYDGLNVPICETLYTEVGAVTLPHYAYQHNALVVPGSCNPGGSSITGIAFYIGVNFPPQYENALFFCDSTRGCIWAMHRDASGDPDPNQRSTFASGLNTPVDLQIGPDGLLYYVELGANRVMRVQYFSGNRPPVAALAATPTSGAAPLIVDFSAAGSYDPDLGDTYSLAWDLDNDGDFDDATGLTAQWTYTVAGSRLARVRATDNHGATGFEQQVIVVGNNPPTPQILTPDSQLRFAVGDLIGFSGSASDVEDGPLSAAALDWTLIQHHCSHDDPDDCHEHTVQQWLGAADGSFHAPDHDFPSYLELRLTATDAGNAVGWADPAWSQRHVIAINNSDVSTPLSDYPVLVVLDATRVGYDWMQADGEDLRFFDFDGTPLAYEIESFTPGGTSYVWVRVPQIAAAPASDFIYLYYGNPSAAAGQKPASVWDASHLGVYHMRSASLSVLDSTSAHRDLALQNGPSPVQGPIGEALTFDGVNDQLQASTNYLSNCSAFTLSGWVRPAAGGNRISFFGQNDTLQFGFNGATAFEIWTANSGNLNVPYAAPFGAWTHVAAVGDGTSIRLFLNGEQVGQSGTPVSNYGNSSFPVRVGGGVWDSSGNYLSGAIDEVQISSVARSADWLRLHVRAVNDELLRIGPAEQLGAGLSATISLRIDPRTVALQFETVPTGLSLTVGSETAVAPFQTEHIVNSFTTIAAPSPQKDPATSLLYRFVSWSDGGAPSHGLPAPDAPLNLTATFELACPGDLDGNQIVDLSDLTAILSAFGTLSGASTTQGDLDQDEDVDLDDLVLFLSRFGEPCRP